ncbi:polysaccharide biosynthesis protein [Mesorhizobium sp. NBSH29]|uniref:dTDP-4-dehydrorhamnose 3,5-epimerase family protein n=1 Tax=Mesorhizobium sp. NBSH29 TaxID=2654249 RepID=UPI0018969606|nr:dTDP-4-dehydrorhamnose 3,5-epimerase family protein [Mesorhizobium sp. NBSH29]QPC86302.1 polysaccharide biosynthesis protein [Mesorhizobium sp. NBSH29]
MNIGLDDFTDDTPWIETAPVLADISLDNQIEGVRLQRLVTKFDKRGDLTVLLSDLNEAGQNSPHVYLVTAAAKSVRAWVYHKRQHDRLAFTNGSIRVVLYDLRAESPTYGKLNILDVGSANKIVLTIPPQVVHGVQNRGDRDATFVNMPTRAYDPSDPDKLRVPYDHPGIPYQFAGWAP